MNFDDFLNNVIQNQFGLDVPESAIPTASELGGPSGHSEVHRDNTMQNVIGHIYG